MLLDALSSMVISATTTVPIVKIGTLKLLNEELNELTQVLRCDLPANDILPPLGRFIKRVRG